MGLFSKPQTEERTLDYQGYFVESTDETTYVIDERTAMEIPSFNNALETIVSSICKLDVKLYQENSDGKVERHIDDYRLKLLNEENNFYGNAVEYKRQLTRDIILNGISYTYVDRDGLDVKGLYRVEPKNVTIEKKINSKGIPTSILADIVLNDMKNKVDFEDLLVVPYRTNDGTIGQTIFESNQKLLTLMYQELEYHEGVYKNASVPFGVLETPSKVSKDIIDKLKATWSNLYKGVTNSGKIAVLENGLTYKPISQNPNDILLLDSRKANINEVEKIFNLPSGILETSPNDAEMTQNTLRNKTIEPILRLIEESLNKALLLEDEKESGYYFRFDTKPLEVIKGIDKVNTLISKVTNGLMTINEGRAELDYNDFANSDNLVMSLGNVLKKQDGTVEVFNIDGGTKTQEGNDE